jgi:hypothetical protein
MFDYKLFILFPIKFFTSVPSLEIAHEYFRLKFRCVRKMVRVLVVGSKYSIATIFMPKCKSCVLIGFGTWFKLN